MKRFLIGAAKVGLGFFMAFAAIAIAVGYYDHKQWEERQAKDREKYQEKQKRFALRDWGSQEAIGLGITGNLKSKWDDGHMRYQIDLSGNQLQRANQAYFILKDSDGFLCYVKQLNGLSCRPKLDDRGRIIGNVVEAVVPSEDMNEELYLRVAQWEFRMIPLHDGPVDGHE